MNPGALVHAVPATGCYIGHVFTANEDGLTPHLLLVVETTVGETSFTFPMTWARSMRDTLTRVMAENGVDDG